MIGCDVEMGVPPPAPGRGPGLSREVLPGPGLTARADSACGSGGREREGEVRTHDGRNNGLHERGALRSHPHPITERQRRRRPPQTAPPPPPPPPRDESIEEEKQHQNLPVSWRLGPSFHWLRWGMRGPVRFWKVLEPGVNQDQSGAVYWEGLGPSDPPGGTR